MAIPLFVINKALKATICLLLLALTFSCANSARILDEVDPQNPTFVDPPATTTLPSGQIPATPTATSDEIADPPLPETEDPTTVAPPADDVAPITPPADDVAPITPPITAATPPVIPSTATVANPTNSPQTTTTATTTTTTTTTYPPPLSFFMHDILGGSHPSARVVTGIIARTDINGIPFSVPNNNIFPLQGGTPLLNNNNINSLINPNTAPFLTGLNGAQTSTVVQNTGNNNNIVNGQSQPFVTAGQLPAGSSLQKLMFGSITVIDDELTEGHDLGSAVVGRAQGFYVASSLDGTSQTVAVTVLLHGGGHDSHGVVEDSISLFGVHRTASPESQIAVVGGTGKYENAKGYATVESIHQEDQHITDGVDNILHFSVYLS